MKEENPFRKQLKGREEAGDKESGAGVPPAAFLPIGQALKIRHRRLPHWEIEGAVYFVTFRLADSLPPQARQKIIAQRKDVIATAAQMGREVSPEERTKLLHLSSRRIEKILDDGLGICHLRDPKIATIVADALRQFDDLRYRLFAWCVMPNHVHVLFQTVDGSTLDSVLHSWKSYSAKAANRILGRVGEFWLREYYDHLIRDRDEFRRALRYVIENPGKAGLENWPWVWAWSESLEQGG